MAAVQNVFFVIRGSKSTIVLYFLETIEMHGLMEQLTPIVERRIRLTLLVDMLFSSVWVGILVEQSFSAVGMRRVWDGPGFFPNTTPRFDDPLTEITKKGHWGFTGGQRNETGQWQDRREKVIWLSSTCGGVDWRLGYWLAVVWQ
ncbi:hypothetical protein RND71_005644 [Anisodus tanguticus]|uniref:Uncharacterized protein n=1 Tax=Anisodus tanguticus TaxID=243964 RepID=A0AAE1SRY0_9SOLA|nr:hypothetical protein RND71_005644 [Anisodus tanguticus]